MGGEGVHNPFGVPRKPPSTHPQVLTIDAWDNFDNTGKNLFPILKNQVRNQKTS